MKITIEFVPHSAQRYNTPGDWFEYNEGNLHIRISQMTDRRYMFLVAIHELTEALLCIEDGVETDAVDLFDLSWKPKLLPDGTLLSEPGDDHSAPYHEQHVVAEIVERIVAQAMSVHWPTYETEIARLSRLGPPAKDIT